MGIGTSKGAFYEDAFHHAQSQWDPKYDDNEITPNDMMTNKKLDAVETDPTTGLGIPIDYKTSSPLVNITDKDIDDAMSVGMGAGPGIIAGRGSAVFNATKLNDLGHAQVLDKLGTHPDDIWDKTGMFKDSDGHWKYEIPDNNAQLKDKHFEKTINVDDPRAGGETTVTLSVPKNKLIKMEDALDHPDLFEAYPQLKDNFIARLPEKDIARGSLGMMDSKNGVLYIAPDQHADYIKSIILHETQHAVQDIEGFSKGSSSKRFMQTYEQVKNLYEDAVNQGADPNSPAMKKAAELVNNEYDKGYTKYMRVKGEVEARNVQSRAQMSTEDLLNTNPRNTEDVPRFVQDLSKPN